MKEDRKIMYASDEAAQKVTVTGWRSSDGRFYGDDEHLARWAGCTHLLCKCGADMDKGYTICRSCRAKQRAAQYEAMPVMEWDGITPLVVFDDDTYFFDEDGPLDYCEANNIKPEDLQLVICKPHFAPEIEPDSYLCDILPEDQSVEDCDPDLAEAFEALNKVIRARKKPISWTEGTFRTSINATKGSE